MLFLVLPAVLFALITWQVVADGPLLRLDADASRALVRPDRAAELLADLGNAEVAVPVLALAIGFALWRGRGGGVSRWWLPPLAAAVPMALLPAVVVPLKDWTARPGTPVVPPADGYFPSGHTATALVAYGSATLLVLPWLRSPAARRALPAGCAVLVLAVSYGLVRRGWHWPLDVVASWCLGAVLLAALARVLNRCAPLSRSTRRSSSGTPSSRTGPSSPTRSSGRAGRASSRGSGTSRSSSSS